jgi:glycosyltransferase involved in cell wall biosynthesis
MEHKTLVAFGYHDQASPRHWTLKNLLRSRGWEVAECHTSAHGFLRKCRDLRRKWQKQGKNAQAMLVTFPGHYLVPLAWLLTRRPRKILFFDAFLSLSDTMVSDRHLLSHWHPKAWALFLLDCVSCHLADVVFVDTEAHRQFFIRRFHLKPGHVEVAYLGAREDLFTPREGARPPHPTFDVFFYGSFIPLQGIEHILSAAALVSKENPAVRFTLIGGGQCEPAMRHLAEELRLTNVTFRPTVPLSALPRLIREADLCLGIFGTSDKAQRVIPHKVYDAVACGVPVLTEDSPAIREKFSHHPGVLLCAPGNPEAIAQAILATAIKTLSATGSSR